MSTAGYSPSGFVEALLMSFIPPAAAARDPETFVAPYLKELGQFTPAILEAVLADLVATQESRAFPPVATCVKRCYDKRDALAPKPKPRKTPWCGENVELADQLIQHQLGDRAAAGGWIIGLWDFIRIKGRRPNELEVDKIKRGAAEAAAKMSEMPENAVSTKAMRTAWKKKNERLQRLVSERVVENDEGKQRD
jgi:hypothetical protein